MPLLKGRFVSPTRPLTGVDPKEAVYTIAHTKEQFRTKEEYEKRLTEYDQPVWTCQCTGQIKLTHEEAYISEHETRKALNEEFPAYLEKPVLEIVHHSTEVLDILTDRAWKTLQEELVIGEPVKINVGATAKKEGKAEKHSCIEGTIYKVDKSGVDQASGSTCSSPSSNKENSEDENSSKRKSRGTPKKSKNPPKSPKKLQPYKYSVKLNNQEKVISGIPVHDIIRKNKLPLKDTLKTFIRSFAWRGGFHFNSPWVVNEELVKKYSLSNKLADIFLSPSKMVELGRKALADKRKSANSTGSKKRKRTESQDKKSPNKKLKTSSTPKSQNSLNFKGSKNSSLQKKKSATPKNSPKKEKKMETPDTSEDEMTLAEIKRTPEKLRPKSPAKSVKKEALKKDTPKKDTPVKNGTPNDTPRKRGRPTKAESERRRAEEEKEGKTKAKVQKKERGTPKKQEKDKKKMKQATLFDMKSKKGGASTPKKSPIKSAKSPTKSPFKIPPLAARLIKDPTNKQLLVRCATQIPVTHIKKLPDSIRDIVLKKYNAFEEKKLIKKMSPEELEEHKKKKKEELKQRLRVKMRKRWLDQNKRAEDTYLELKPLPTPKLVETPDGIANEQFGDVTMITEFINCYKDLLTPEDDTTVTHVTTEALLKSVVANSEGYDPTAKVLVTFLQTLLQDGIAEDYTELDISLSELPVNECTASELVRLCLRRKDHDEAASDDSEENEENDLDLSEDLLEQLESCEFFELTAEHKLQVLMALCHRLMGSYSVQDYMEEKQKEYQDLWKQRNQCQKEKNDELRDEKQKRKEQKAKGIKPSEDVKTEDNRTTSPEQNGCTINSFYGKKPEPEDDADLVSVVRNRRVMAAKAVEEKRKQDKEEKIRREKEYVELRKQKDRENIEKKFQEGAMVANWVARQSPLGTDRNHNRYWIFHAPTPGLFVEKGWAPKDVLYNTRPKNKKYSDSESSESEAEIADNETEVKRGRKRRTNNRNMEKTFPHTGQNLWFMFTTVDDVDKLIKNLHPQGIRESALKTNLESNYKYIVQSVKSYHLSDEVKVEGLDVVETFREELLDMEGRLRVGGLGGVMDYTSWENRLKSAKSMADFGRCLAETQEHVLEKFLKGMMLQKIKKSKIKSLADNIKEQKEESEKEENDEEDQEKKPENDMVAYSLHKWKEAIECCPTFSRLHVLMGMLDSCIKWEKSAENAKCKICRKKGDEDRLLLCDDCNQAYHLYCMRPALLEVPKGDWLCPACTPLSARRGSRGKNYRELAGEDSQSEDSQAVASHTSRYGRTSNFKHIVDEESESEEEEQENEKECARCGGDEGLYPCSTCPSSFHLMCHEPPLRREPRSSWRCFQCLTGVRLKSKRPSRSTQRVKRTSAYDLDDDYGKGPKKSRSSSRSAPQHAARSSSRSARKPPQRYQEYDSFADETSGSEEEDEETEEDQDSDSNSGWASKIQVQPPKPKTQKPSQRPRGRPSKATSRPRRSADSTIESPSSDHQTRQKGSTHLVIGEYATKEVLESSAKTIMDILKKLRCLKSSWPFVEPVDVELVPDYFDIVKKPMDLQTIENKCISEVYKNPQEFVDDIGLMFDNAHLYNKAESIVGKCSEPVENLFCKLLVKHLTKCSYPRRNILPRPITNGHMSSDTEPSSPVRPNNASPSMALGDHAYYSPSHKSKSSKT